MSGAERARTLPQARPGTPRKRPQGHSRRVFPYSRQTSDQQRRQYQHAAIAHRRSMQSGGRLAGSRGARCRGHFVLCRGNISARAMPRHWVRRTEYYIRASFERSYENNPVPRSRSRRCDARASAGSNHVVASCGMGEIAVSHPRKRHAGVTVHRQSGIATRDRSSHSCRRCAPIRPCSRRT